MQNEQNELNSKKTITTYIFVVNNPPPRPSLSVTPRIPLSCSLSDSLLPDSVFTPCRPRVSRSWWTPYHRRHRRHHRHPRQLVLGGNPFALRLFSRAPSRNPLDSRRLQTAKVQIELPRPPGRRALRTEILIN